MRGATRACIWYPCDMATPRQHATSHALREQRLVQMQQKS